MNAVKIEKNGSIARITLSKPPLNIFEIADLENLSQTLKHLETQEAISLITIESDQKVFSAGVDIKDHTPDKVKQMLEVFHDVFYTMLEMQTPTVTLVKSGAIGGGCELAVFSDFVLASEKAYFSQPEIKLGCFPPVSLVYFPYLTGEKKALEMILLGEKVFAQEALACGLVNKVFSEDNFDEEARKFIDIILQNPDKAVKTTLKAYKKLNRHDLKEKIKLCEKLYLEEIEHDKINVKNAKK